MAGRRRRATEATSRAAARAAAIADQMLSECGLLLELYVSIFSTTALKAVRNALVPWDSRVLT